MDSSLWNRCARALESELPESQFNTWVRPLQSLEGDGALKLLAPMLVDLVRPGGSLVLSGVLSRQVDEVSAAYADRLPLTVFEQSDGWACLAGTKPR